MQLEPNKKTRLFIPVDASELGLLCNYYTRRTPTAEKIA